MNDRYQPLRDALEKAAEEIAAAGHAGWGNVCREASDTIAALLKERDALREALKPFAAIPLERIETPETFGMDVLRARAALADGEDA